MKKGTSGSTGHDGADLSGTQATMRRAPICGTVRRTDATEREDCNVEDTTHRAGDFESGRIIGFDNAPITNR